MPCSFCYYANMACKPFPVFYAIHNFAFLYPTLDFTHNLKKNRKKSYTAKNSVGDTLFSFTIHGTFSINSGVSATCTKSSYTYSISSSAWQLKSASASRSSNKAIGDAEFIKKILLIKVDTLNPHVVLSCSNNGSLS